MLSRGVQKRNSQFIPAPTLFALAASKLRVKFNAQLYFLGFFFYYVILCIKNDVCTRMFIMKIVFCFVFFIFTQGHFFIAFRARGWKREKHPRERETLISCLLCPPLPGIKPAISWVWDDTLTN